MDRDAIAAGLLHDTVEDTVLDLADVELVFGATVCRLVEGETKVSKLPKMASQVDSFANPADEQAENLRSMFIAMADDWRIVVIKLADRLHNMRTLQFMPVEMLTLTLTLTLTLPLPLALALTLPLTLPLALPLTLARSRSACASRARRLRSSRRSRTAWACTRTRRSWPTSPSPRCCPTSTRGWTPPSARACSPTRATSPPHRTEG